MGWQLLRLFAYLLVWLPVLATTVARLVHFKLIDFTDWLFDNPLDFLDRKCNEVPRKKFRDFR